MNTKFLRSQALIASAWVWLAPAVSATVTYDNYASASGETTGDFSFDIDPAGTPRGVIVYILTNVESDEITSVTADGVAMTEVSTSPALNTSGEDGGAHCFFLGSGVPNDILTIAVTTSGTATTKMAGAVTLTASADLEVVDADTLISNGTSGPQVVLSLASRTAFVMLGSWSGIGNNSYAPLTGWTSRLEHDFGNQGGLIYTYDTVSTSDVLAGYTQGSDDAAMHALAVTEVVGGATRRMFTIE